MKFERIRYPDGQISAKLVESGATDSCSIRERINSYEDLMYIRAIGQILDKQLIFKNLYIPCLFGQRSDRQFAVNQSFDLKLIAEIINSCNFNNVQILDPHSDVSLALINNSEKLSSFDFVRQTCLAITGGYWENFVLVSPDAGAYKKVFEYGEKLNLPVVGAMKHRTGDGKISMVFAGDLLTGKHCLIVDDLCDGGATFLALATKLREYGAEKVYLYVTHGIFSKKYEELKKVIDHIYCTNSVRDIEGYDNSPSLITDYITQYKVM